MRKSLLVGTVFAALAPNFAASAATFDFSFTGPGVSGSIELAYGATADLRYSSALVVTGISGTFSDSNLGVYNASIGMLVP
jgi:hypothetical protein